MVAALLAGGAGNVGDGAPGVHDQRELLRRRPDVQPRRVIPKPARTTRGDIQPQIQPRNPPPRKKNWGKLSRERERRAKNELYRPVGEEIIVEAHAGVGVVSIAEAAPGRGGGEAGGVGVGEREREHQRRPRGAGPIGGSRGGGGGGSDEEEEDHRGGEGHERAEPTRPATRHGEDSSRRAEEEEGRGRELSEPERATTCWRRRRGVIR